MRWDLHVRAKLGVEQWHVLHSLSPQSPEDPGLPQAHFHSSGGWFAWSCQALSVWDSVCWDPGWLSQVGESVGLMSRGGGTAVWALQEDVHVL